MNRKMIAKELIKVAKSIVGENDHESQEWRKYFKFILDSNRDFSEFGTKIHTYLDRDEDDQPIAKINLSATGAMSGSQLEKYLAELDAAVEYIRSRESEAREMWERMHPETFDFE